MPTATKPASAHSRTTAAVPLTLVEHVMKMSVEEAKTLHAKLTPREREGAGLMAQWVMNRDIAHDMGISPKTWDIHRKNIFDALQTQTSAGVARIVWLCALAEQE